MHFANNLGSTNFAPAGSSGNSNDATDGCFVFFPIFNVAKVYLISQKHDGTNRDRDYINAIGFGD